MPEIKINVNNRIAKAEKDAVMVCRNSDYAVVFNFDEEWSGFGAKTALFTYNGKTIPVPFSGSVCKAPELIKTTEVLIGVTTGDLTNGDTPEIQTTTSAYVPCFLSAKDETDDYVEPPTPEVYDELISMINSGMLKGEKGDMPDMSAFENALIQGGITSKVKTEATYDERVTANGARVVDGSKAILHKVVGNTIVIGKDENGLNGTLVNASFGGIKSTAMNGEESVLEFPKTEMPWGKTIDLDTKKIIDSGATVVLTGTENFGQYNYSVNGVYANSIHVGVLPTVENNNQNALLTDGYIINAQANNRVIVGGGNAHLYWIGILDILGFTTAGKQATSAEFWEASKKLKAYLAQRYADGNPVTIRYLPSNWQNETDISANDDYKVWQGGTEAVLGNDGASVGANLTFTQSYTVVNEREQGGGGSGGIGNVDLKDYQKKQDNTLNTTSKLVAGAINEVNAKVNNIPSWAKQSTKPTYSYSEITNKPTLLTLGETSTTAYEGSKGKQNASDISTLKTSKQDKLSFEGTYNANSNKVATVSTVTNKVSTEIAKVVANAPTGFDTLKEIADWIAEHPNSVAALNAAINANTLSIQSLESSKQDKLTAGDNITIHNGIISATGGGSGEGGLGEESVREIAQEVAGKALEEAKLYTDGQITIALESDY